MLIQNKHDKAFFLPGKQQCKALYAILPFEKQNPNFRSDFSEQFKATTPCQVHYLPLPLINLNSFPFILINFLAFLPSFLPCVWHRLSTIISPCCQWTSQHILHTFLSVNPSYWQGPAPMGSWRVTYCIKATTWGPRHKILPPMVALILVVSVCSVTICNNIILYNSYCGSHPRVKDG